MITEASVRELIEAHGFKIANLSQHLMNDGHTFEYRMIIKGKNSSAIPRSCRRGT